jgi:hypothetical protein
VRTETYSCHAVERILDRAYSFVRPVFRAVREKSFHAPAISIEVAESADVLPTMRQHVDEAAIRALCSRAQADEARLFSLSRRSAC